MKRSKKIASVFIAFSFSAQSVFALTPQDPIEAPLVRGPGISQGTLEAVAVAEGRTTLTDYLDHHRPGEELSERLQRLFERAQSSWLSGSLTTAKRTFLEITDLTLRADWRESQREVIHYSYLRLAQLAPNSEEQNQWLTKAARAFPDLQADPSLFPPPLYEKFRSIRAKLLASAKGFETDARFQNARYLLINGKRFELSQKLTIRLPDTTFRVTVLSDFHPPVTRIMHRSELESFEPNTPAFASGTCQNPEGATLPTELSQIAVVYAVDCIRVRSGNRWLPLERETPPTHARTKEMNADLTANLSASPAVSSPKNTRTWLWAGLAVLATGALLLTMKEINQNPPAPEPVIKPVEREGY